MRLMSIRELVTLLLDDPVVVMRAISFGGYPTMLANISHGSKFMIEFVWQSVTRKLLC